MRGQRLGVALATIAIAAATPIARRSGMDAAAAPTGRTTIVTLGTAGEPRPRPTRAQSANLVVVGGNPYLIDAGENAVRRVAQAGIDPVRIRATFITHDHSDHVMGLPALLATQWEFQRRDPIRIYGPAGTEALVRGALAFLRPNTEIRATEGNPVPIDPLIEAHDREPGSIYRDEAISVTAIENSHFHFPAGSPAAGRYRSFSYRIATRDRIVVFTGDTGPAPQLAAFARDADTLVTEVSEPADVRRLYEKNGIWARKTGAERRDWLRHQEQEHLTPRAICHIAAGSKLTLIILTHLTPAGDSEKSYARWADEVRDCFPGRVEIARDLGRY